MTRKIISVVLSVLLSLLGYVCPRSLHAQEKPKYTLAVLNLVAQGIPETETAFLSESLHTQVSKVIVSEKFKKTEEIEYTVLERSQMDKIFGEFDIQNTGCTDLSCAVEFGKMLSVKRIIIGSVGLVGRTYSIAVRIVDVETSTTLSAADYTYTGPVDDLLTKGIQNVVNELLGTTKSHKKLYIIAGIAVAGVVAAIAGLSSSGGSGKSDTGGIYIRIPVPED